MFGGHWGFGIAPGAADVGENCGDLCVGKGGTLGRHFKIVGLSRDVDGTMEAVKDDFYGAV